MDRLTIFTGECYESINPVDLALDEYSDINFEKIVDKLARYEDLEEQGRLLKLPCKVGDVIWDNDFGSPCAYTITAFSFGECEDYIDEPVTNKEIIFYYSNLSGSITGSFAESEIKKTVFLTKSEAEAKLKELKGVKYERDIYLKLRELKKMRNNMTEGEAIKELQENIDLPFGSNVSKEAAKMAVQALEKQTPKKLEIRNATNDDIESELRDFITMQGKICRCPTCKDTICISGIEYCWYCGQKLDWSEESEE